MLRFQAVIGELQEKQGMEEPGVFLKEGSSFEIGEVPAVKTKKRQKCKRRGSHFEGEERGKELKDKCLLVLYNRSGRELSR